VVLEESVRGGRIAHAVLSRLPTNRGCVMTECNYCHHTLVESYGAEVDLLQNSKVLRTASLVGLHFWCARDWVTAETERLREQ
jgi:hypothetical protein